MKLDYIILILSGVFILFFPYLRQCTRLLLLKRKLNRQCKRLGAEILWHRSPLTAMGKPGKGFDFCVSVQGKRYHVMLLSAHSRFREYCFVSPTELMIYRKLSVKGYHGGRFMRIFDLPGLVTVTPVPIDLEQKVPEGDQKILLFFPVARDVTWIAPGKGKQYLGTGDLMYNRYRLLTRSGFLEEIESPGRYLRTVNPWEEY